MRHPNFPQRYLPRSGAVVALSILLLLLANLAGAAEDNPPCEPAGGFTPICGVVAPEDLVRAPRDEQIIFGQMEGPGGIHLLHTREQRVEALFARDKRDIDPTPGWGSADCPAPATALHAHGIDLHRLPDGRWRLLAVNHAGRESVEFFELTYRDNAPALVWRGCTEAPDEGNFNDVAGLADGSFLVTHMGSRSRGTWEAILARLGVRTGVVYHWRQEQGFSEVPGTATRFPNGLILSADQQTLYLNEYFGKRVLAIDWRTGERLGEARVEKPDNLSWTRDGQLLVASHHAGLLALARSLDQAPDEVSLLPYSILAIDPVTMATRTLLRHEGAPMGAGTVALDAGDRLYIGSYRGDRIVHTALPE